MNDVVIIGAGPAGISAAIQLKRYGMEPVLMEKEEVGGLLRNANLVENYPGFPKGISGPELAQIFKKQLENLQIKVHSEKVLKLDYEKETFFIKTDQRTINCQIVIIASGTESLKLTEHDMPSETESHIFYEVYPLLQVANKKIAIIGAGDAAFDYALNISKKNDVVIINRGREVKCLPLLRERVMETKNISYLEDTHVRRIKYHDDRLILTCRNTMKEWETDVSYLIVAIGREPCLDFFSENLKKNLGKLQKSKMLYMIGDVKNDIYRQTAIAAGDGIKSAMEIYKKLKEETL